MSRTEIADDFLEGPCPLDVRETWLVERLQANDDAAVDELFQAYREPVARVVYRMLGDSREGSDVIQGIFLKVFRSIHGFRGDSALRTWVFRIAFSEILKRMRWRRKYRPVAPGERDSAIQDALGRLSRRHRSVLVLRDMEGLSYSEISDVLGVSIGTVRSRLVCARADLRRTVLPYLSQL